VGGLQAPHVIEENGKYLMFYGDWGRICLAQSGDGKDFKRVLNAGGEPDLFSGPYNNTRDPMVLKHGGKYYCYYMGHKQEAKIQSAIFCFKRSSNFTRRAASPHISDWSIFNRVLSLSGKSMLIFPRSIISILRFSTRLARPVNCAPNGSGSLKSVSDGSTITCFFISP
jgi:hypothetical protein